MDKRIIWGGAAVAAALLFAIAYFTSPYFAIGGLKSALEKGDRDKLEELVDFPRVRENLKADLNAAFMAKMQADPELKNNPFAGLALALVPMVVDKAIDGVVTPAGLSKLIEARKSDGAAARPGKTATKTPEAKPVYKTAWSGLNRFRVAQTSPDGTTVTWVFSRDGLFRWRLIRIELPREMFENLGQDQPAPAAEAAPSTEAEVPYATTADAEAAPAEPAPEATAEPATAETN